ncbi:MAG: DUF2207 domain-containing protein [Oscillospiraceae bacterium]|nr:DUF2207 domain-containing protein [Oscillospiraceae bacterium]
MRRLRGILFTILCCMMLAITVSAENTASKLDSVMYVASDGSCTVSMSVSIKLESAATGLTFPLPGSAKNVTMNGASVRTSKSGDVILADLSYLDGMIGEYNMTFQFSLPSVVDIEKDEKTGEDKMVMNLPMLSGFAYPIDTMTFTITLPADAVNDPVFYSGYLQQSVESCLEQYTSGKIITGATIQQLNDHETMYVTMQVNQEMFPGITIFHRDGNPETIFMAILAALALIYWIATLRTAPILRQHRTIPLEGVTAGEMGSRLTMAGGDLTMMVFTWAQLGYIHIHADKRGRVLLYKRMDMGNERGPYENKCFKSLFARKDVVDATGNQYAKLCRQAARTVPGIGEMYRRSAGSVKLFRVISCGVSLFCGICLAMNMVNNTVLQVLLAIVLGALGVVTAWNIQEGAYRVHIRGKVPLYIGFVCMAIWLLLGVLAGQFVIALLAVLMQILAGFLAAYGGRRSDLGRYSASQVLGLRHYLKHVTNRELRDLADDNPDYFFDMLPYAIALGVDGAFAKQYGRIPTLGCPYLTTDRKAKRTPEDWARLLRKTADKMDQRQKKMQLEKFMIVTIRKR